MIESAPVQLLGMAIIAAIVPVYLGLLLATLVRRMLPPDWERLLLGVSTGVVVYLFFDLMHEATELTGARDLHSWLVFLLTFLVGFLGLVWCEQAPRNRLVQRPPVFLPYMVALGMGLHNLGEGLALGASYAAGQWHLSALLIAGFALHNATEGVGVVSAAGKTHLDGKDLLRLGAIAGLPTAMGTMLGGTNLNLYFTMACYSLAAGALLYVTFALVAIGFTMARRMQMAVGVFGGICLMFVTAMLLTLWTGFSS
ncbi:MAG TPA: zinc transporter ZupT [Nitrospiraceae bacterium]|nr:zinc transporter ZupT [Nitrospiraceae bacterium]